MTHQRFCGIVHHQQTHADTPDVVQWAVDDMATQMDNYSSSNDYGSYGPKDHYTELNFTYSYWQGRDHYWNSFRDTLEIAANDYGVDVHDGDVWCLVDDAWFWGYGAESDKNPYSIWVDGLKYEVWLARAVDVNGGRTSLGTADPHIITGQFVIHEIGHAFNVSHEEGNYEVKGDPAERYNTTPMATSYVCNPEGGGHGYSASSTCHGGTGASHEEFCSRQMCEGVQWCYDSCNSDCGCGESSCAHTPNMTGDCTNAHSGGTKGDIDQTAPLS